MREPFVPIDETCVQHLVVENHHHYNPDRHDDVPIDRAERPHAVQYEKPLRHRKPTANRAAFSVKACRARNIMLHFVTNTHEIQNNGATVPV